MLLIFIVTGVLIALLMFGLSLLELYTQLGRYQAYWTRQNQQADSSRHAYVAFGDSAAQGVGASRPQNGYVGIIADELRQVTPDLQVINLSKSGGRVKDVIDTQLPAYEALKLKDAKPVITVEIGANDMFGFEPKRFESEMDELMKRLPKQAVISDIPSFSGSRFKNLEPNVEEANRIMYKLARKYGFELAPLYARVKADSRLRTFAVDLFHPSDFAYRKNWAAAFLEQINN